MKKVWDKGKRKPSFYLVKIPLFIAIILVNIFLLSWLGYVIHCLFTDAHIEKSLIEWTQHLYILFKRMIRPILDSL